MLIRNLTPHILNIHLQDGKVLTISPDGLIARVAQERTERAPVFGIPVTESRFGEVENLPAPVEGHIYIVSGLVLAAVPDRPDVFAPGEAIRDDQGRIIGCEGLSCAPAYRGQASAPEMETISKTYGKASLAVRIPKDVDWKVLGTFQNGPRVSYLAGWRVERIGDGRGWHSVGRLVPDVAGVVIRTEGKGEGVVRADGDNGDWNWQVGRATGYGQYLGFANIEEGHDNALRALGYKKRTCRYIVRSGSSILRMLSKAEFTLEEAMK